MSARLAAGASIKYRRAMLQRFLTRLGTVIAGIGVLAAITNWYNGTEQWQMLLFVSAFVWIVFAGLGWAASAFD